MHYELFKIKIMCGIAGIITPNARNYTEEIQKMTRAIAHRGPDAGHGDEGLLQYRDLCGGQHCLRPRHL